MVFKTEIDFDDFYDLGDFWRTSFNLPNGARFIFWNCSLRYVKSNDYHYLEIISDQRDNIEECLLILSFCTTIPLSELDYDIISIDNREFVNNQQQDKMVEWDRKLSEIEQILRNSRNSSDDIREMYFDFMRKCILGARNGYRGYVEDEFMMYFKPIEKISKLYLNNYGIIRGQVDRNLKSAFQRFLKEDILHDTLNLEFDSPTLQEVTGKVYNLFKNEIVSNNHRRISVAWERLATYNSRDDLQQQVELLNKIDSLKIHELVKVRNKISHGEIVELPPEIRGNVEYLSYQMISLYIFGKKYDSIHLSSKKFNYDFWS